MGRREGEEEEGDGGRMREEGEEMERGARTPSSGGLENVCGGREWAKKGLWVLGFLPGPPLRLWRNARMSSHEHLHVVVRHKQTRARCNRGRAGLREREGLHSNIRPFAGAARGDDYADPA